MTVIHHWYNKSLFDSKGHLVSLNKTQSQYLSKEVHEHAEKMQMFPFKAGQMSPFCGTHTFFTFLWHSHIYYITNRYVSSTKNKYLY